MLKHVLLSGFLFAAVVAAAQRPTPAELNQFRVREDSLKTQAFQIINGEDAAIRFRNDSVFTRILVRALLQPHSFRYPFDSLRTISRLYAPDSSFRIFTWQVVKDDDYCRQRGFIQLRTQDGTLKFFPLRDVSEFTESQVDTVTNAGGWMGAVYYRIIRKQHQSVNYYTLLGYDENDTRTTRKWIDVLWFNEKNEPVLGLPNGFSFAADSLPKPSQSRFLLEYKKDGRARVQFDEEMDLIIFDHLVSETNEPKKKYTLIPDGDYEGFVWKNGQWLHVDKVFDFKLKDGEAPIPEPLDSNKEKLPPKPQQKTPSKKAGN
ncbi:MAG TPA: hypothetical protein PKE07_04245 [Lacibacter sp.]|nr:hypothetical protein [Lacibacter sp.]HMO89696.1 hypothetical protein [Lacibacter sp.]